MKPTLLGFIQENYITLVMLIGVTVIVIGDKKIRWTKTERIFPYISSGIFLIMLVQYIEKYYSTLPYRSIMRNLMSATSYAIYPLLLLLLLCAIRPQNIKRWILFIPEVINIINSILIILNVPFTAHFSENNHFTRGPLGYIPFGVSYFYLFLFVVFSICYFREKNHSWIHLFLFIAVSLVVTNILEVKGIVTDLHTMSVIDILLYSLHLTLIGRMEAENELLKTEMQLYHRQIQPHFICNSLGVIRSLMPDDSEEKEVLDQFTRFLRGSVDMLAETECIRAEREFKMVQSYLYMEQRRFENKVMSYMDIQEKEFWIPPFTVQMLVENAVKHGIRKKKDGRGTVTVRSYRTDKEIIIEIEDDGVGFDTAILSQECQEGNSSHIGLNNVKRRLELMCDGTLEIESRMGEGTLARVHIPEKR